MNDHHDQPATALGGCSRMVPGNSFLDSAAARIAMHVASFLLVLCVYLHRLDAPLLWNDEADTAVFGRNVLQTGVPAAFDGRNVSTDGDCLNLARSHLVQKLHPWLQYYVAAASLRLFGDDTFGARALFAILGATAFFPLAASLKTCTHSPVALALVLLLNPQVVLFQRNCRYFSILILAFVILMWLLAAHRGRRPWHAACTTAAVAIAMFHTHPLAALCSFGSATVLIAFMDRSRLRSLLVATAIGCGSWMAWFAALGPAAHPDAAAPPPVWSHPGAWASRTAEAVWISIADLDYVNAIPLLAWLIVLAAAILLNKSRLPDAWQSILPRLVATNLLVQILFVAAFSGSEGNAALQFSLLRYMPHLVLVAPVPLWLLLERQATRRVAWAVFLAVMCFNVGTVSFWLPHLPLRRSVVSWWPSVYEECWAAEPDALAAAIEFIQRRGADDAPDAVIRVEPQFLNDVLIFYLGRRYLIAPWNEPGASCPAVLREHLPGDVVDKLFAPPTWNMLVLTRPDAIPLGWSAFTLPGDRDAADGSRPELPRRRFRTHVPQGILLFHRDSPAGNR